MEQTQKRYIVYVQGCTQDGKIKDALVGSYNIISGAGIKGLISIHPVTNKESLDSLLDGSPASFRAAVDQHRFEGIGMFSEWESESSINDFQRGVLHNILVDYVKSQTGDTLFRVIQLRGDQIKTREIRGTLI